MLVGKDHMLLGKDHAGEEGSCWWGKIMLVGKDRVGANASCWLWKIINFADYGFHTSLTKNTFFAQNGSLCVRSQHKSQQTIL